LSHQIDRDWGHSQLRVTVEEALKDIEWSASTSVSRFWEYVTNTAQPSREAQSLKLLASALTFHFFRYIENIVFLNSFTRLIFHRDTLLLITPLSLIIFHTAFSLAIDTVLYIDTHTLPPYISQINTPHIAAITPPFRLPSAAWPVISLPAGWLIETGRGCMPRAATLLAASRRRLPSGRERHWDYTHIGRQLIAAGCFVFDELFIERFSLHTLIAFIVLIFLLTFSLLDSLPHYDTLDDYITLWLHYINIAEPFRLAICMYFFHLIGFQGFLLWVSDRLVRFRQNAIFADSLLHFQPHATPFSSLYAFFIAEFSLQVIRHSLSSHLLSLDFWHFHYTPLLSRQLYED